jgi:dTDP-4-dehydrorhamnose 3,5-epimerase
VRAVPTSLPEVLLIQPDVLRDQRGFFLETYHVEKFRALGIAAPFVQDNYSYSSKGTVRGLHLQVCHPQGKLVRVVAGEIFDVAVDVRRGSPTFGHWVGTVLSASRFTQCYIPPGFAHGFAVTSDEAHVEYKCTDIYDSSCEVGIAWNDDAIGIGWPVENPLLSDRDRQNPFLEHVMNRLPQFPARSKT